MTLDKYIHIFSTSSFSFLPFLKSLSQLLPTFFYQQCTLKVNIAAKICCSYNVFSGLLMCNMRVSEIFTFMVAHFSHFITTIPVTIDVQLIYFLLFSDISTQNAFN